MAHPYWAEALKAVQQKLEWAGCWPNPSLSLSEKIIKPLLLVLISIGFLLVATKMCQDFYDVRMISFGLCCLLAAGHCILKHAMLSYNKQKFLKVIDILNDPLFVDFESRFYIYARKKMQFCKVFINAVPFTGVSGMLTSIMTLILSSSSEIRSPIPFPTIIKEGPFVLFLLIYGIQIIVLMIVAVLIFYFDGLLLTLICIASVRLEILRNEIISVTVDLCRKPNDLGISKEDGVKIRNHLRKCVIKHIKIEEYIKAVEDAFAFAFLLQVVISLIITTICTFNCILLPFFSWEFWKSCLFFLFITLELVIFCIAPNDVIYQSNKIGDACYSLEWYRFDLSTRKYIFIMMERSKRPFVLTAGNFFPLSYATLASVLKTAFSYFTVLWQLYSNSEKI